MTQRISSPVSFPGIISAVQPLAATQWPSELITEAPAVPLEDIIQRQAALEEKMQAAQLVESSPEDVKKEEAAPLIELDQSLAHFALPEECVTLDATFVQDVTVTDGQEMAPSTSFEKVWKLRNSGSHAIPAGTRSVYVGGHGFGVNLGAEGPVLERKIEVGEEFELRMPGLIAPATPGEHLGFWRLMDDKGERFGDKLWIE